MASHCVACLGVCAERWSGRDVTPGVMSPRVTDGHPRRQTEPNVHSTDPKIERAGDAWDVCKGL